jgi:hypothetical protein
VAEVAIAQNSKLAARTLLFFRPAGFLFWLVIVLRGVWSSPIAKGLRLYTFVNVPVVILGAWLGWRILQEAPRAPQAAKNFVLMVFLLLAIEFYTLFMALVGANVSDSVYQKAGWDFGISVLLYGEAFMMLPPLEAKELL